MSGDNINPGPTGQAEPIHYCEVSGLAGRTAPTACGRTEQPKPAANVWANVTCAACLAKRCPRDVQGSRCLGVDGERHVHRGA